MKPISDENHQVQYKNDNFRVVINEYWLLQ